MWRATCLLLTVAVGCSLLGCRSARIHAVHDGQTTWRSNEVPLERNGGSVTVHVRTESDEEVTVLLVDSRQMHELTEKLHDARPVAAAGGRTRGGHFEVRFTGLAPGTYYAHAFRDLDGDGCQTLASYPYPFRSEYTEPHSGFERIDVTPGSRDEIELLIREERS